MAHVKQKGGYKGSRDSKSKRLGVKLYGGQSVKPGNVIIRQRGTKFYPGKNVKRGNDDTLYAVKEGKIQFVQKKKFRFDGSKKYVKVVNIVE